MALRMLVAAIAACLTVGISAAADPTLDDFAGQWVGKVTVETSGPTDFPTSVRDAGVTLTPDGQGGFSLEWSTVRQETGDPKSPEEKVSDTVLTFPKGDAANRWKATESGDPAAGKAEWFARLEGQTLTVSGFTLTDVGKAELQTYRRTLENGALGLSYTRVVDGDVLRRASGALTKFAK